MMEVLSLLIMITARSITYLLLSRGNSAETQTILVTPVPDVRVELDETLAISIASVTPFGPSLIDISDTATVTIVNDDQIVISIQENGDIAEGNGTSSFTVSFSNPADSIITVFYSIAGTAVNITDYSMLDGQVSFPISSTRQIITITPVDDDLVEGAESLVLSLSTNTGPLGVVINSSTENSANLNIIDNDEIVANIFALNTTASEVGNSTATIRITLDKPSVNPILVEYTLGGSATNGNDYQTLTLSVTIPANSTAVDVTLLPLSDLIGEGTETVSLILDTVSGAPAGITQRINGSSNTVEIDILDEDINLSVSILATDSSAMEATPVNQGGIFELSLDNSIVLTTDLLITYSILGTAENIDDYSQINNTALITAGQNSTRVFISPVDDNISEPLETIVLQLISSLGAPVGVTVSISVTSAADTVTLDDNDNDLVLFINSVDATADEANFDEARFELSLGLLGLNISSVDLIVTYTISGSATNNVDYQQIASTVLFPMLSTRAFVTITPLEDNIGEGTESITLLLQTISGVPVGVTITPSTTSATANILDEDTEVIVFVIAGDPTAEELSSTGAFFIELDHELVTDVTVTYSLTGNSNFSVDYSNPGLTRLIAAGSTRVLVNLSPFSDDIAEGNESVLLTITSITGSPVGVTTSISSTDNSAEIIIVDDPDDTTVTLSVISFDPTAMEGDQATAESAAFRISIDNSKEFSRDVTVSFLVPSISGTGNAREGDDYVAVGQTRLIPEGSTFVDIEISPLNDNISEGAETVILQLAAVTGQAPGVTATAALSPFNRADLTILDDDTTLVILLEAIDATATEAQNVGDSVTDSAFFRISIQDEIILSTSLIIDYTLSGIAANGMDYSSIGLNVTIASGATQRDVFITPIGDNIAEGNETFDITLTADSGAANGVTIILSTNTEQIVIIDEDTNVELTISSMDSTANENPTGTAEFTISLNKEIATQTSLTYSISGSAVNGLDYSSIGDSFLFSISSTALTTVITPIPANGDNISEGDETVVITLQSLTGLPLGVTVGIIVPDVELTIVDNPDELNTDVTLATIDGSIAERSIDTATFRISIERPVARDLVINYSIDGSAIAGTDYQAIALSVLIPENSTFIDIVITPIAPDNLGEGPETLSIEITTISGQPAQSILNLVAPNNEFITIIDDPDDAQIDVTLIATDATAGERDTTIGELNPNPGNFRISLDNPADTDIVVSYSIASTSTADNGVDYNTLTTAITIPALLSFVDVSISPLDDVIGEGNETVVLILSTANGEPVGVTLSLALPNQDQVVIEDDPADLIVVVEAVALDGSISEAGETEGRFNLRISNPLTLDLNISYTLFGSATNNQDYESLGTTAVITGNAVVSQASTNIDVIITAIDDLIAGEGDETVSLILTTASYPNPLINVSVSTEQAVIDVIDDDIEITLQLLSNNIASEDGDTASFMISIGNNLRLVNPLTVLYSTNGSAIDGQDYNLSPANTIIPGGSTNIIVTVIAVDDIVAGEGDETLSLTLNTVQGAPDSLSVVLSSNSPVVTLIDNDTDINIEINTLISPADEEGFVEGLFEIEITDGILVNPLTVGYTIFGTADNGLDYVLISSTQIIAPLSSAVSITITPLDDRLVEGLETIQLQLTSTDGQPSGLTIVLSSVAATIDLLDEDDQITFQVNATDASASELGFNTGTFQLSIAEDVELSQNITVEYTLSGSAINSLDYEQLPSFAIFEAPSTLVNITITPLDDAIAEGDESVQIDLITITGIQSSVIATISGATDSATVIIADADANLDVVLTAIDSSAAEIGPDSGQFQIILSSQLQTDLTVFYSVEGSADNGTDYRTIGSSVVFVVGSTQQLVNVIPESDDIGEGVETVSLTLSTSSGFASGISITFVGGLQQVFIDDDPSDAQVFVRLVVSDASAAEENANTGAFLITLDNPLSRAITVGYTLVGTALNGDDFTQLDTTVLISAGSTSVTTIITPVEIDDLAEGTETVGLIFQSSSVDLSGVTVQLVNVAQTPFVEIIDNPLDSMVLLSASVVDGSAAESSSDQAIISISTDRRLDSDLLVTFALSGSANNTDDYQTLNTTVLIQSSIGLTATSVVIIPVDDDVGEGLETISLALVSHGSVPLGINITISTAIQVVDLMDNDTSLVIDSNAAVSTLPEDGSGSQFNINILNNKVVATDIVVTYTFNGSATIIDDYVISQLPTLLIPALSSSVSVTISTIDDLKAGEEIETVSLVISTIVGQPSGVDFGIVASNSFIDIVDADTNVIGTLTVIDASAAEVGSDPGTFRFAFDNGITFVQDLTLNYTLAGSTASAADFIGGTALSSSAITAGVNNLDISFVPIDDGLGEGLENLTLTLTTINGAPNSTNIQFQNPISGSFNIEDDPSDSILIVSVAADASLANEGSVTAAFTIDISTVFTSPITIHYTVIWQCRGRRRL